MTSATQSLGRGEKTEINIFAPSERDMERKEATGAVSPPPTERFFPTPRCKAKFDPCDHEQDHRLRELLDLRLRTPSF